LKGILSHVEGQTHWFFDTRWNYNRSGEMQYRMPEREAAIVRAWFEQAEGRQAA
jgi:hypothetical protein